MGKKKYCFQSTEDFKALEGTQANVGVNYYIKDGDIIDIITNLSCCLH